MAIEPRLYGFALVENKFYINGSVGYLPAEADGTYINLVRDINNLNIYQDYNGGYGLYLFQEEDFFAVSNSFQCLLDYLKGQVGLSVNIDYAKYFITDELASLSVSETLVNEISLLPKNIMLNINLDTKKLTLIKSIEEPQKVSLNSKEGVEILDRWHYKWQSLLVGLQRNKKNIRVDLTGGMDSRAAFSIFNSNQVSLNELRVNTSTGTLHTHKEDFEIASMIADRYKFKLNKRLNIPSVQVSTEMAVRDSFNAKLGIHKQMYFKVNRSKDKLFYFTGFGGESIRSHWKNPDEFIEQRKKREKNTFVTLDCEESIEKVIRTGLDEIQDRYDCASDEELMHQYYQNTRLRSHFGKNTVENFIGNNININPLMDRELQKLSTGDDTLLSLILVRYLNEIKDIKFDSGRSLDKKSMESALQINSKYANHYESKSFSEFSIIDGSDRIYKKLDNDGRAKADVKSSIIDLYQSKKVETLVTDVLGYEAYRRGYLELFSGRFIAERMMYSLLAIASAQEAVAEGFNNLLKASKGASSANNLLLLEVLESFKMARIDIKNFGTEDNNLKITDYGNGVNYKIMTPRYFNKNKDGVGYVIESKKLEHKLQLECIGNGELVINLKGVDIKDSTGNRIKAWADFVSFKIDDQEHLTGVTPVWHDKPLKKSIQVYDGQIVDIYFKWLPHNYDRFEVIDKINTLYENLSFRPL